MAATDVETSARMDASAVVDAFVTCECEFPVGWGLLDFLRVEVVAVDDCLGLGTYDDETAGAVGWANGS